MSKAAVAFVLDHSRLPEISENNLRELKQEIFQPLETYSMGRNLTVKGARERQLFAQPCLR